MPFVCDFEGGQCNVDIDRQNLFKTEMWMQKVVVIYCIWFILSVFAEYLRRIS